jgi:hypothetical protein
MAAMSPLGSWPYLMYSDKSSLARAALQLNKNAAHTVDGTQKPPKYYFPQKLKRNPKANFRRKPTPNRSKKKKGGGEGEVTSWPLIR